MTSLDNVEAYVVHMHRSVQVLKAVECKQNTPTPLPVSSDSKIHVNSSASASYCLQALRF
ncbi:hypothetical protein YC2023_092349 [Brassica napus]